MSTSDRPINVGLMRFHFPVVAVKPVNLSFKFPMALRVRLSISLKSWWYVRPFGFADHGRARPLGLFVMSSPCAVRNLI